MKLVPIKKVLLLVAIFSVQYLFCINIYCQNNKDPFNNYGLILRKDSGKLHPSTAFVAYKPNIVICAAHTINKPGEFLFQPVNSIKRFKLKKLYTDTINDIGILVSDTTISLSPLTISKDTILIGDSIYFCGFDFVKSRFISGRSVITSTNYDNLKRFTYQSPSIQGFSGGAILNSNYEVIGVQIQVSVFPWQDPLKDDPKTTIASDINNILEKLFSISK